MKKAFVWVVIFALSLMLCAPRVAFAQDAEEPGRITIVEEGDPAPFAGYLYDVTAAAKLKAQLDAMDESCQIRIDKSFATQSIEHNLALEKRQIRYDNLVAVDQLRFSTLNEIIDLQEGELNRVRLQRPELYFAGGIVAGIGLTVLAGWTIGQVAHGSGD